MMLVNMLVLVVTSRVMSPAAFGTFAIAQLCVDLAAAVSYAFVGIPMLQAKRLQLVEYSNAFTLLLVIGILAGGILAVSASTLEHALGLPGLAPLLRFTAFIVPLRCVTSFFTAALQRCLRVERIIWAQTRSQILSATGVTLFCAVLGLGAWALLFGLAAATFLEMFWTMRAVRVAPRIVMLGSASTKIATQGVGPLSNRLLMFVSDAIDKVVIGAGFGAYALGIYTRASNLVLLPQNLAGLPAQNSLFSWFSRFGSQPARVSNGLTKALNVQGLLLAPLTVAAVLAAPILVPLLLGHQWTGAIPIAQVLFVGAFARLGTIPVDTAALTLGHGWNSARRQLVSFLILACGLALSIDHSLIWAAAAVALARISSYLLGLRFTVATFEISWRSVIVAHGRGIVISVLGLLVGWMAVWFFSPHLALMRDCTRIVGFVLVSGSLIALGPEWLVTPGGLRVTGNLISHAREALATRGRSQSA